MKTRVIALLAFFFAVLALDSCEKYEYFQSEKKVRKQLMGSWEQVRIPLLNQNGDTTDLYRWTFTEDLIYRKKKDKLTGEFDTVDTANYTIDTKLMKVLFITTGFNPDDELDADWTAVRLDGEVLQIATDYYDTKGVRQLEFTRVK